MITENKKMTVKLLTIQIVVSFVVFALALFLAAGTVVWPAGWAFLVLYFGFGIAICLWLLRHNPGLLMERMTGIGKRDLKAWDKVFIVLLIGYFHAWLFLMPLDAVRFHWSHMPVWLQVVGAILLLCSFYILFMTVRENSFLSPAVRIQKERGHTVVSTGPYRYVRHPMYAAFIPLMVGSTLLLGSWYGLPFGLIWVVGLAFRALQEERVLREELAGYDVYMSQVKYRLIPYIW